MNLNSIDEQLTNLGLIRPTANNKAREHLDRIFNLINDLDVIDLLSKISTSGLILKTYFLNDYDKYVNYHLDFDNALNFLVPFYMSHKVNNGTKIIKFAELMELVKIIRILQFDFDVHNDDHVNSLIDYSQNELTEILPTFRAFSLTTFLPYLDEDLKIHFNISSSTLVDDILTFLKTLFHFKREGAPTFELFINSFEQYCDKTNFMYPNCSPSLDIIKQISFKIGDVKSEDFDYRTPLKLFDKSRKIFLNLNDNYYCFTDTLITSKFIRCLERLFQDDKKKHESWKKKMMAWNENSVKHLFLQFLPKGEYYANNFYFEKKGIRYENDGVLLYNGFLFVIEIKGGKVNPDSIHENQEDVKKSYKELVEQGCEQCSRLILHLEKNGEIELLNEDNSVKLTIKKGDIVDYIPICVCFEEIGTYLPGYDIRNGKKKLIHPITINFYDLLTVFDYLGYPLLIVKYLIERSKKVDDERLLINDELVYLGIFTTTCLNLNAALNDFRKSEDKVSTIYFDNSDFTHEIEFYYSNINVTKSKFNINDFVKKIISNDINDLDNDIYLIVLSILDMSREEQDRLELAVRRSLKSDVFVPQAIRANKINDEEIGLLFFKRPSSPFDKKMVLANLEYYFKKNPKLGKIYCAFIRRDEIYYSLIKRDDEQLLDDSIQELSKSIKYQVKQNEIYRKE